LASGHLRFRWDDDHAAGSTTHSIASTCT